MPGSGHQGPQQYGPNPPGPGMPGPGHPAQPDNWQPFPPAPRSLVFAKLLQVIALVAVPLGLAIPFDSTCLWSTSVAWASFATVAAIGQLAPMVGSAFGWNQLTAWRVGAGAVAALIGFWVLLVLPSIASNSSFVVTLGVAAAGLGCWLTPGRRL